MAAACSHRHSTMSSTQQHKRPLLLGPWRRAFQWLTVVTIILIPWIQPNGVSIIRVDIPSLSLLFFGQVLRIPELYLLLLFILVSGAAFLLITLVFGRLWCGWACPQTTLTDIAEWLTRRLKLKIVSNRLQGALIQKIIAQTFFALLALLVSANIIWYFIEPQRFLSALVSGNLHIGVLVTFCLIALVIYLDLALVRRLLCREFCPYGRIQTSFVDAATLTLQLPDSEKKRCIKCNSCVRTCPMDIDIRNGYQIECINCGRCLDACRAVMAKRNEPGLIYYTFGVDNRGPGALLNPRVAMVGLLLAILISALSYAVISRAEASLNVSIVPVTAGRVLDGQQATLFNVWLNNRTTSSQLYQLNVVSAAGETLEIRGQTQEISINPGENRQFRIMVLTPVHQQSTVVEFQLIDSSQRQVAGARARITPAADNN